MPTSTFLTHIRSDHPEIEDVEVIRQAIEDPDYVVLGSGKKVTSSIYYSLGLVSKFRQLLVAVVVEWEEEHEGCVKTCYVTPRPKKLGQVEWIRTRPK